MNFDFVIELANKNGVDAEVYYSSSKSKTIKVQDGKIEEKIEDIEAGTGIRLFKDNKTSFVWTTDLSNESIQKYFFKGMDILKVTEADNGNVLPQCFEKNNYTNLPLQKDYKPDFDDMEAAARKCEETGMGIDSKIKGFRDIEISFANIEKRIVNSNGINCSGKGYYSVIQASAIGESDGDRQASYDFDFSIKDCLPDAESIARRIVERTAKKLNPKSIKTGKYNIILTPEISANLFSAFMPALYGINILRKRSLFINSKNKKIASDIFTIEDNPFAEKGINLFSFDGEGVPVKKKYIIEKGVLKNYLHNKYSAVNMKEELTGNGLRGSFKAMPGIKPVQMIINPSDISKEDLYKDINEGIEITDIMGLHTIDTVSGNFSLGAAGNIIRNGISEEAVSKLTIAGNFKTLLNKITAATDDLRYFAYGAASPSVLINDIDISSE